MKPTAPAQRVRTPGGVNRSRSRATPTSSPSVTPRQRERHDVYGLGAPMLPLPVGLPESPCAGDNRSPVGCDVGDRCPGLVNGILLSTASLRPSTPAPKVPAQYVPRGPAPALTTHLHGGAAAAIAVPSTYVLSVPCRAAFLTNTAVRLTIGHLLPSRTSWARWATDPRSPRGAYAPMTRFSAFDSSCL